MGGNSEKPDISGIGKEGKRIDKIWKPIRDIIQGGSRFWKPIGIGCAIIVVGSVIAISIGGHRKNPITPPESTGYEQGQESTVPEETETITIESTATEESTTEESTTETESDERGVEVHDHVAGNTEIINEAGCTEAGEETVYCSVCGERMENKEIPATGHNPGRWVASVAPACETVGVESQHCTACGMELRTREISALGHSWENGVCTRCGLKTEASNQSGSQNSTGQGSSGSQNSTGQGSSGNQNSIGQDNSGSQSGNESTGGSNSGNTMTESHTHVAGNTAVVRAADCTRAGEEAVYCSVCGEVIEKREIPVVEHTPGQWGVAAEATCVTPGKAVTGCTVCGQEMTKEIPAAGHNVGRWATVTYATCETPGEECGTCLVCGEIQTKEIPARGHSWENGYCRNCQKSQDGN